MSLRSKLGPSGPLRWVGIAGVLLAIAAMGTMLMCASCAATAPRVSAEAHAAPVSKPLDLPAMVERTVKVQAACPLSEYGGWSGSGVVLGGDSVVMHVATADHVVNDPDCYYTVLDSAGELWPTFRVAHDSKHDVAVISTIGGRDFQPIATLDARLGDPVTTVGYPYDRLQQKTVLSVSRGTVVCVYEDSIGRYWPEKLLRTDAVINGGSSGGPAFSNGRLIGLTVGSYVNGDMPYDGNYYIEPVEYVLALL